MSKKRTGKQHAPEDPQQNPNVVVLGQYVAAAAAAEERRKAKGDFGKSPMPGQFYEYRSDQLGLIRLQHVPLDAALAELTRKFAKADKQTRAAMRGAISMDEFYTLLAFSHRAAVFALRDRSIAHVTDGLTAVAMIEVERVDWRDILVALSLLHHAAERIGADARKLFHEAGQLCEPGMTQLLDGFVKRSPSDKNLRTSWGYDEVEIDGQVGLIRRGFCSYHPTLDVAKAAVEIADLIAKDKYLPTSVEIAAELPAVWLETKNNAALEEALRGIRAGASIAASLRPGELADCDSQMFLVFLVETADESAARTLLQLSQTKKPESYAMLGLAKEKLFCLVVARSFVVGVDSFETTEKLSRFSKGLTDILRRHAG